MNECEVIMREINSLKSIQSHGECHCENRLAVSIFYGPNWSSKCNLAYFNYSNVGSRIVHAQDYGAPS
jgi:hypothetical protein